MTQADLLNGLGKGRELQFVPPVLRDPDFGAVVLENQGNLELAGQQHARQIAETQALVNEIEAILG